jgi:hypothetical protein
VPSEWLQIVGILLELKNGIKSIYHRIRYGTPLKLYLRNFKESVSQNSLTFSIECTTANSLFDHILFNYSFDGKRYFAELPIINEDKSLEPFKSRTFNVDCSSIENFPFLLFRKYSIKTIKGLGKKIYFRRTSNMKGSELSTFRYHIELLRYILFRKIKDKYTNDRYTIDT